MKWTGKKKAMPVHFPEGDKDLQDRANDYIGLIVKFHDLNYRCLTSENAKSNLDF